MRSEPTNNIRVTLETAGQLDAVADALHMSRNRVGEDCINQMLELIKQSAGDRKVPKLVAMVDAAEQHSKAPPPLPERAEYVVKDKTLALNDGKASSQRPSSTSASDSKSASIRLAKGKAGLPQ